MRRRDTGQRGRSENNDGKPRDGRDDANAREAQIGQLPCLRPGVAYGSR
jgi:hypothetical protein